MLLTTSLLLALLLLLGQPPCAASTPHHHRHHARALTVVELPNLPPATGPFDAALGTGTPNLPSNDSRVAKAAPGCYPEQVRLTYWTESSVLVSWTTCDAVSAPRVTKLNTEGMTSLIALGTASNKYTQNFTGVATSYVASYKWPAGQPFWATAPEQAFARTVLEYASPAIHHVLLTGLLLSFGRGANAVRRRCFVTHP